MRKQAMAAAVLLLSSMAMTGSVRAQQVCQTLLQGGIFDTNVTTNDTFAADYFRSRYCNSGSGTSNSGLNLGIPIKGVPVQFGATSGSSNQYNICDDRTASFEAWQKYRRWSSEASPVIAKAFVDCINAEGTQLWTERSQVTNAFSLHVRVNYRTKTYPPTKIQFSFTPNNVVGTCGPKNKSELEGGVEVGNLETFKVVCEIMSRTSGAEIGLIASTQIPYGSMSIRSYRPAPLFALSTMTSSSDGVKVPNPGDSTYGWGADTLLDRYDGQTHVRAAGGTSWAAWNFDNVTPGLYQVLITYAAAASRPLRLLVNGRPVLTNVIGETTGALPEAGWKPESRQQRSVGQIRIADSTVELRLETMAPGQSWPHFKEMRLVFVGD